MSTFPFTFLEYRARHVRFISFLCSSSFLRRLFAWKAVSCVAAGERGSGEGWESQKENCHDRHRTVLVYYALYDLQLTFLIRIESQRKKKDE